VIGGGAIYLAGTRTGSDVKAVPTIAPLAGDTSALPGYVLGSDSAPLEVREYADFQCPACRMFAIVTMPDVADRLIKTGRVRWRFVDFPLQGHAKSLPAHQAAACAGEQGKFWDMFNQLYYNQSDWDEARNSDQRIRGYAEKIGVDLSKYDECVGSNRYLSRLTASGQRALRLGITSTPTFVIGAAKVEGAVGYDRLKAVIDSLSPPPPRKS
jgi:protein-disulfide isomerase